MGAVRIKKPRNNQYTYDVAFSFAEEDRAFVDRVAALLQQVTYYYDQDKRTETWGRNLYDYLSEVYRTEARFCVMFLSRHYSEGKRWSRYERELAQARSFFEQKEDYILPFRLDDSDLPELLTSMAYLSRETYDEQSLARAIMDKVARSKRRRFPLLHRVGAFLDHKVWAMTLGLMIATALLAGIRSEGGMEDKRPDPVLLTGDSTPAYYKPELADYTVDSNPNPAQPRQQPRKVKPVQEVHAFHFTAICRDGWLSQSTGSGTCSWHDGVDRWVDTVVYGETIEACRQKSMKNYRPGPGIVSTYRVGNRRACSGTESCTACKNCTGCKHCAKEGGSCGVCE